MGNTNKKTDAESPYDGEEMGKTSKLVADMMFSFIGAILLFPIIAGSFENNTIACKASMAFQVLFSLPFILVSLHFSDINAQFVLMILLLFLVLLAIRRYVMRKYTVLIIVGLYLLVFFVMLTNISAPCPNLWSGF